MNLAQYVERGNNLFPDRIALRFEGKHFTYAQLNQASNRWANSLEHLQIGRGDRVALWLPNSADFIIAYLGTHKVGAVAVTINTALKAEEVTFILNDSGAQMLIATAPLYNELVADHLATVQQVVLSEGEAAGTWNFADLCRQCSPNYHPADLAPTDPAVLLYTSGTTGFPKGALLSHGALMSAADTAVATFGLQAADRILLPLSMFHSFAQTAALVPCLAAGATLLLHRPFDVAPVLQSIQDEEATCFFGVPALYILLHAHAKREQLRSVRRFISAGAALPTAVAQQWYDTIGTAINEGYGLTEICLGTFNHHPLTKPGSAGRPLDGVHIAVVDELGKTVLPGALGEIVVQTPTLMDGYWQRPTETATVLRDGWFHSGDIGHMDEDGYIYIIDRVKDMVNVGGIKVYPSEVENVLYQHPAVTEVAVFGVPEPLLGEQVQATVVLKADQTVTGQELIAFCRQKLAEFKAPSKVVFVDQLPKSRTGKILKRLLRDQWHATQSAPETNGTHSNSTHSNGTHSNGHTNGNDSARHLASGVAQTANVAQTVAMAQWISSWLAAELQIDATQITEDRPFADYGMTSVLAVRLADALGTWLGRSVPAILLWNFPTLATLVQHLSTEEHPAPTRVSVAQSSASSNGTTTPTQPATEAAIALIGIGCRFPGGANSPEQFWQLLRNGVDTARPIPADRWAIEEYYDPNPNTPGKHYVRAGHFLDEIPYFDAPFFGITPLEAAAMDPQQRLLLEVCWEALEHANLVAEQLRESQTGIYIGGFWDDYSARHLYNAAPDAIDSYRILSNLRGMMAGRLAYVLGLHGPAMQLDTACSSSLLAVHLATQALRNRECDLALAGGVNLVLAPEQLIGLCHMGAVSPDGRCKTFAAEADGFGIGEGAGIVVLKRLADAQRDGDPILAVIRGSAVNHDGASNGLTAPNGRAQEALLRKAIENAGIQAEQIGYIETHGTGTVLGDPIEVQAISTVLGQDRKHPLLLGSVKTNIGHLSGAAGIASLIKVVLALGAGEIPPNLHLSTPNPHIPWARTPLQVPTQRVTWPTIANSATANDASSPAHSRVAGVSSFGLTGTNVHLIVEEVSPWLHESSTHSAGGSIGKHARQPQRNGTATAEHSPPAAHNGHNGASPMSDAAIGDRPHHLLTLSAKSQPALAAQIAQFDQWLAAPDFGNGQAGLADLCYTAATRRTHFEHRLAIVAADVASARAKLQQAASTVPSTNQVRPRNGNRQPQIAFLFPGQGPQYVNMGRQLYTTQPLFRRTIAHCDEVLHAYMDQPLLDILYGDDQSHADTLLNQATYAQPALFAVEYALAQLWRSWGVEPSVIMGHSLGEYAAACLAGVFSLEDGLQLVATRGRLMQEGAPQGRMVAVLGNVADVQEVLAPYRAAVALAAVNTPQSVVIAGAPDAVATAEAALQHANLETRPLKIYVASHSPLMEPILEQFMAVARRITYQPPRLPVVSNLTGAVADKELTTPEYWGRHLREPVQFAQGMATLITLGVDTFLETGPKSTLLGLGQQCWSTAPSTGEPRWLTSFHPKSDEWPQLLESLGTLYEQGAKIDWQTFDGTYPRTKVNLPRYPFQRQRYWIDMQPKPVSAPKATATAACHPLLGSQVASALAARNNELLFENCFTLETLSYLADHTLFNQPIVPGAAYVEMALAAGAQRWPNTPFRLRDCAMQQGLFLPVTDAGSAATTVQLLLSPVDSGYQWQIYSQADGAQPDRWTLHASGQLEMAAAHGQPAALDLAAVRARCHHTVDLADYEQALQVQGIGYGPAFQALTQLAVGVDEALGAVTLPSMLSPTATTYQLHPVLLDAALRVASSLLPNKTTDPYLPFGMDEVRFSGGPVPAQLWSYVQRTAQGTVTPDMQQFSVTLLDETGQVVAHIANLTLRRANRQSVLGHQRRLDWLYELRWRPVSYATASPFAEAPGRWLILADRQGRGTALATQLTAAGAECLLLEPTATGDMATIQKWLKRNEPGAPIRGIISLWALDRVHDTVTDDADVPNAALQLSTQALQLIKAIVQSGQSPRLWFVTQAAVGVDAPVINVQQAPLWGMARTLQVEQPELACTAIDLSSTVTPDALFAAIWFADEEKQVLLRGSERFVARLTRWEGRSGANTAPPVFDPTGSYLITGGLGGLGLVVAQWLVAQGARQLILAGRRGVTTPAATAAIVAMESAGAKVIVMQTDLGDVDDTRRLVTHCQAAAPLRGVMHAAGIIDDGLLLQQSPARFATVMAAKVAGSWHLHTLTKDLPLDFFVCFSSVAALLGNGGQGNYAAANAFMDALAHHRRQEGQPALSINWGGWAEVGLAAELVKATAAAGLGAITPTAGVDLLGLLMAHDTPQVGVLPIAWPTFEQTPVGRALFPVLTDLVTPAVARPHSPLLRQQLAAAPTERRSALLKAHVQEMVTTLLGTAPADDESFFHYGLDSLLSIQLANRLAAALGIALPATVAFKHGSVTALTDYLEEQIGATLGETVDPTAEATQTETTSPTSRPSNQIGEEWYPQLYNQQELFIWHETVANPACLHIQQSVYIHSVVDVPALEAALQAVMTRHEALRTVYARRDGQLQQRTLTTQAADFAVVNVQNQPWPAINERVLAAARQPFDLAQGPLLRVRLFTRSANNHLLLLVVHHIAADATALSVIVNELWPIYSALHTGQLATIPPVETTWRAFARGQLDLLQSSEGERLWRYWQAQISGAPTALALATDAPRPTQDSHHGRPCYFELDAVLTHRLRQLAQQEGCTLYAVLMTGFQLLLHGYTAQRDLLIAAHVANRNDAAYAAVVGYLADTFPIRAQIPDGATVNDVIQQVQGTLLAAMEHQGFPMRLLAERLDILPADPTHTALCQVWFTLLPLRLFQESGALFQPGTGTLQLGGLTLEGADLIPAWLGSWYDLELILTEGEEVVFGTLVYKTDLFVEETVQRMIADLQRCLRGMITNPTQPVADLVSFLTYSPS